MTPPTERERKWLEQLAKDHLPAEYLSANGGVMAALAEVCDKTKEACAKVCDDYAEAVKGNPDFYDQYLAVRNRASDIRNLEITGE